MKHKSGVLHIKVEDQDGPREFYLRSNKKYRVGHDTSNDLTIYGDHVPKRLALFEGKGDHFVLNVDAFMDGQISNDHSSLNIQDLIDHDLLPQKRNIYEIPIKFDKRGWVKVGPTRFEFDFNSAANEVDDSVHYWNFSRRYLHGITNDLPYKIIVLLFIVLGTFWSVKVYHAKPIVEKKFSLERVTRRVARFIIAPKKPKAIRPKSKIGVASSKETPSKKTKSSKSSSPEAKKQAAFEAAKKAVVKKGLLGLIAGKGKSGKGGTVVDALIDKGLVRELDNELQSGKDLQVELPSLEDNGGDLSDILSSDTPSVDNLITNDQVQESFNLKEKGGVNLEEMSALSGDTEAVGHRSQQSIRDVIVSYMGRITYVYNKYLKTNPDLGGKIVIEIKIAASGEVLDARIVSSSMNSPAFENELLQVVRHIKFKPIPEGVVTVENPFVFSRSDR
ncbi:MAG: energy transducer TonB [Calditrichaeota bacterium]|nr:energy transducer TonB [Calditrichota bacterium]